jgi:hypothetical protein
MSIHRFTVGPSGMKHNKAPHINRKWSPVSEIQVHWMFTCCYFQKLSNCWWWRQTRYNHQYLDTLGKVPPPLPDVIESEMFLHLAVIIQMGHCMWDCRLVGYSGTALYTCLQQHYKTGQILTHSSLPILCRQQERNWYK